MCLLIKFPVTPDLGDFSNLPTYIIQQVNTVEPPNRGPFGTTAFVLSSESVLFSDV